MYFDEHRIVASDWTRWTGWDGDITERNAFMALDFVREFCIAYKRQAEALDNAYANEKQKAKKEFDDRMSSIQETFRQSVNVAENERNNVMSSISKENADIERILKRIVDMELLNHEAAAVEDYVELRQKRMAVYRGFVDYQKERARIAGEICEEKKRNAGTRKDVQERDARERQAERVKNIDAEYATVSARLEDEYRILFAQEYMSDEKYHAYCERVKSYQCSPVNYQCRKIKPDYVHIGSLSVQIPKEQKSSLAKEMIEHLFGTQNGGVDEPYVIKIPYCQKISEGVSVFITDNGTDENAEPETGNVLHANNSRKTFEDELPMLMMKTFMSLPAGEVEAFTVDSGKLGAVFHDLLVLGSEHPRIISGSVSETQDIEERLSILRSKIDGIANNYGSEFDARMKREPYYVLGISNFPFRFSAKALTDLSAIVKNAAVCGVAVFILASKKFLDNLSGESKILVDEIMGIMHNMSGTDDVLKCEDSMLKGDVYAELESIHDYRKEDVDTTLETLRNGIRTYRSKTVSFEDIYPSIRDQNTWASMDSTNGLHIPIGIKGASDVVHMSIGSGGANSEHHVLIEGSTGTGKSSFLHTLIMSTLISYSQKEVEIYLVDFKSGVEFKIYADHDVPSLKIVSIQSEREFGLQVFRAVKEEMDRRADEFRITGATGTGSYKAITNKSMPKIMLIIDEYQELFCTGDEITTECEGILRTLVLEGRAYGIHVILATQNIRVAKVDPEIYQQMMIRIALKGSENVLASDNDGSQQLVNNRDGVTIYNNNRGERTANKLFQTAYLGNADYQNELLEAIGSLQKTLPDTADGSKIPNKILYTNIEDNRRHVVNRFINGEIEHPVPLSPEEPRVYALYLGESYDLKVNLNIGMLNHAESNLFVAVPDAQLPKVLVNCVMSILYSELACPNATRGNRLIHFVNMAGERVGNIMKTVENMFSASVKYASPAVVENDWAVSTGENNQVEMLIENTYEELNKRKQAQDAGTFNPDDRLFFILAGMEHTDILESVSVYESGMDEFGFGGGRGRKNVMQKIAEIIQDGPALGINCIMSTGDITAAQAKFGDRFFDAFALRIAQGLNEADMGKVVKEYHLGSVQPETLIFLNKKSQANKKFRVYEVPDEQWIRKFALKHQNYEGGR